MKTSPSGFGNAGNGKQRICASAQLQYSQLSRISVIQPFAAKAPKYNTDSALPVKGYRISETTAVSPAPRFGERTLNCTAAMSVRMAANPIFKLWRFYNMKTIINENQRGLLFKSGKFMKMLEPGKYYTLSNQTIEILEIKEAIASSKAALDVLLKNEAVRAQTVCIEVDDCQLALHFVNGKFSNALPCGKYAFFTVYDTHDFQIVDISSPEVSEDIPEYIFSKISDCLYTRIEVLQYQKARLYFNQKLVKILDAGTYYFWKTNIKVDIDYVDTRLTKINITGQEILTQDKVSIRVNFVCNYRIADYIKVFTEIDDYEEQLHVAAQLALRDYVGQYRIDEILENKEQLSQFVFDRLKAKEKAFFIEITDAGVKDIILPGEIRDIMNTVLIAEKRAQANVITRREEVASTRSLLNTAKLMDENQTLYKLKELEYVERICENVGNITLNGNGDLLSQLTAVLRKTNT